MKPYNNIFSALLLLLLTAVAGCSDEEENVVVIVPQNKLVAVAGENQTVKVNEQVQLDGSASYDGNHKPFSYKWSIKSKASGSAAVLTNSDSAIALFTPDVAGVYVLDLFITQDDWTASDQVIVNAQAQVPTGPSTIVLSDNISTATTLTDIFTDPLQPDYLVTNNIDVRADLTIMPGVVIVFEQHKALQIISGSLRAKGTADNGIVFKGSGVTPGYWTGIVIHSNSDMNEMEYVTIKQAGSSIHPESGVKANVVLAGTGFSGAAFTVRNSNFSESGGYGLFVQGMSSLNQFAENTFTNNLSAGAYIPAAQLHKLDTESLTANNGVDGIETGGALVIETEVTWKKLRSGSYVVTSDIATKGGITINPGASFKIKNGVTIKVTDNGSLKALGTENSKIIFSALTPGGRWNGLYFNSYNENNQISFCEIADAGLNKIADAEQPGNVVIGDLGKLTISNSVIKNGLGYGLVTKSIERVNADVATVNTFADLQRGFVYPLPLNYPDRPALTGVWVDMWSSGQGAASLAPNFYNTDTGVWFDGAANPWSMNAAAFGIQFEENGNFTWTIAEHSPWSGCESYSAEYITGTTTSTAESIVFNQERWRSKFVNSCDTSQNVDMEVTPQSIEIQYQIVKIYNMFTGEELWELKFTNPDGSTFSFYRR